MAQVATKALPDWGTTDSYPIWKKAVLIAALLVLVVAIVVVGLYVSIAAGLVLAALGVVKLLVGSRAVMAKLMGAKPLVSAEGARAANIVAGLAAEHGLKAPALYVIKKGPPNAVVFGWRPAIAVTGQLLESFSRTELESVLAHSVARANSPTHLYANLAKGVGRPLAPSVGYEDDITAAALTRYPPGLVRALEKAQPIGKRFAPLWFVADSPSHRPVAERIAALQDL